MKKTLLTMAIILASSAQANEADAPLLEPIGRWSGYVDPPTTQAQYEWIGGTSKKWKIWTSSQRALYDNPEEACKVSVETRRPHDHDMWRIKNADGDMNTTAAGGWREVVANMDRDTIWCEGFATKVQRWWMRRWWHSDWIKPVEDVKRQCHLVHKDDSHSIRFLVDRNEDFSNPVLFADHGTYEAPDDFLPFVASPYPDGQWDQAGEIDFWKYCRPNRDVPYIEQCDLPLEHWNTVPGLSLGGMQHSGTVLYRVVGGTTGKVYAEGCAQFHGDPI